jgi:WhiB family redox-sensing transcriptional regulator
MTMPASLNLRVVTPAWTGRPALDDTWTAHAACGLGTVEAFYPDHGDARTREPRRICAGCPVKLACREYAVAIGERYGVWGGLGPGQLVRIQAARNRAAKAARRAARDYATEENQHD